MTQDMLSDDYFDDYLDEIGVDSFKDVVVTGTDWTTETIIRQVAKGNISLSPIYQRRDAWTPNKKSLFIESIFLGMPIPQLVLAENPYQKGKFIVLDGKQRLLSILQFAGEEVREDYKVLKLRSLPILSNLNNKTYSQLEKEGFDFSDFENQWIRTVIIKNAESSKVLSQIFYRLNTGSLPLSPQELRFALHPGKFTLFIDEYSETCNAVNYFLKREGKKDFRMRDVELLLRLLCNTNIINEYSGNLKKYLDDGFERFTNSFDKLENNLIEQVQSYNKAQEIISNEFGDDGYQKWKDGKFETRKNRAIFETFIYVLSHPEVRAAIRSQPGKLKDLFIGLCDSDPDFIEAIEQTTKSIPATTKRFNSIINLININYGTTIKEINLQDE